MTDFDRDDRVRINDPGSDLHGRTATVDRPASVLTPEGYHDAGYRIACDTPLPDGTTTLVLYADQLQPLDTTVPLTDATRGV